MMLQRWSRSSDDPDPVTMIHIEWWSRSSDDDPNRVTIQIQRQRWIEYKEDEEDEEDEEYADDKKI